MATASLRWAASCTGQLRSVSRWRVPSCLSSRPPSKLGSGRSTQKVIVMTQLISTIAIVLGRLLQMPFLQGYRTQISAVGLIGLAVYMITVGQTEFGITNFLFALGLLGIRFQSTPDKPVFPPAVSPSDPNLAQILHDAETLDEPNKDREIPGEPKVLLGFTSDAKPLITDSQRALRRRDRREQVIQGLSKAGVSGAGILAWLPVIMALLQVMPDVAAIIQKILDAIKKKQTPTQFAKAEKLTV